MSRKLLRWWCLSVLFALPVCTPADAKGAGFTTCGAGLQACLGPIEAPLDAGQESGSRGGRTRVELDVRIVKQPYMLCLAASVSMVLEYWGFRVTPMALAEQVAVYKGGTVGSDYVKVVEASGFHAFLVQPPFEDLLGHLDKGRPVIISLPERRGRHAMVLIGYDLEQRKVWLNDPAAGERKAHAIDAFRREWEKGDRWTFLIVPREGRTPAPRTTPG